MVAQADVEKFNSKVVKKDGCWGWSGAKEVGGYGVFRSVTGKNKIASRFSWGLFNGEIPVGMCVLHRCDTPECSNPEHLFLGTRLDNILDMTLKHRTCSPLSPEQVTAIRNDGRKQKDIALEYGVSQTTISKIKLHKTWRTLETGKLSAPTLPRYYPWNKHVNHNQ